MRASCSAPAASTPTIASVGARSTPNCFARSVSRTRLTSSIATLSVSTGSSSMICRVCRHVSHPRVWVKNTIFTDDRISANASRSLSWSAGDSSPISLFEQIVERFASARRAAAGSAARRRRRARLPLDRRSRREVLAVVRAVLRRDARRQLRALRALPPRARVEGDALDARVQRYAASRAALDAADRHREQIPAARAAKHFVRRHQVGRLRPGGVLQLTTRRALLRRARRPRPAVLALPRFVLIAALAVLAIAHDVGPSSFRNSSRYLPQIAGSEWVPCPRVCAVVGSST